MVTVAGFPPCLPLHACKGPQRELGLVLCSPGLMHKNHVNHVNKYRAVTQFPRTLSRALTVTCASCQSPLHLHFTSLLPSFPLTLHFNQTLSDFQNQWEIESFLLYSNIGAFTGNSAHIVIVSCDVNKSIHSPTGTPGILTGPVLISILINTPTNDSHRVINHGLGALGVIVNSRFVEHERLLRSVDGVGNGDDRNSVK